MLWRCYLERAFSRLGKGEGEMISVVPVKNTSFPPTVPQLADLSPAVLLSALPSGGRCGLWQLGVATGTCEYHTNDINGCTVVRNFPIFAVGGHLPKLLARYWHSIVSFCASDSREEWLIPQLLSYRCYIWKTFNYHPHTAERTKHWSHNRKKTCLFIFLFWCLSKPHLFVLEFRSEIWNTISWVTSDLGAAEARLWDSFEVDLHASMNLKAVPAV